MASINKIRSIHTHEGAKARNVNPLQQLERSVMSCMLWEGEFYEDGETIANRISELCQIVAPDDILKLALKAKNDMRLRHAPLLLVSEVFKNKWYRKKAGSVLSDLISRPDDITEFLSIYWKDGRKPLAKQIKLALGKAFHKFDEYQLAKYNGGKKAVKLVDALRLTHPEPSELLGKLRRGELSTPITWEVELSKPDVDKKKVWSDLLLEEKLGGLALLRNIRNMREADVDDTLISDSIRKIKPSKLLPINFISAGIYNPQFEPVIEEKLLESFKKEKVGGKTTILIDTSYSMNDGISGKSKQ